MRNFALKTLVGVFSLTLYAGGASANDCIIEDVNGSERPCTVDEAIHKNKTDAIARDNVIIKGVNDHSKDAIERDNRLGNAIIGVNDNSKERDGILAAAILETHDKSLARDGILAAAILDADANSLARDGILLTVIGDNANQIGDWAPTDPVPVLDDEGNSVLDDDGNPTFEPGEPRTTTVKKAIEDNELAIDTDRSNSIARDDALGGRIDNETSERKSADVDLGQRIDTERVASISRDDALGGRIDDERTASVARDTALGGRIDKNSDRIDQNQQGIKDALALSLAIPSDYVSPGKNFSLAAGMGFTDGAEAIGMTGTFRFSENFTGYAGGSSLIDDGADNEWAGKLGARYEW